MSPAAIAARADLLDRARLVAEQVWWEQLGATLRRMLATVVVRELHDDQSPTSFARALTLAETAWDAMDPTTQAELIAARNLTVVAMGPPSADARR